MLNLKDLIEILGGVFLTVIVGMIMTLPTVIVAYFAYERGSWLLGILAFVVFLVSVSVAVYIGERWGMG